MQLYLSYNITTVPKALQANLKVTITRKIKPTLPESVLLRVTTILYHLTTAHNTTWKDHHVGYNIYIYLIIRRTLLLFIRYKWVYINDHMKIYQP